MDENERQARRAVVAALAVLSTAFGKEMSDEQIDIYINALYDLPADQLERAVHVVIATERFFPAIATIREAALSDDSRLSAEEGWAFVCRRIRTGGRSAGSRGLSPEIQAGVDACGGWPALCQSENPTGDRIAFVRAYGAFTNRRSRRIVDRWNAPKGLRNAIASIGRGEV